MLSAIIITIQACAKDLYEKSKKIDAKLRKVWFFEFAPKRWLRVWNINKFTRKHSVPFKQKKSCLETVFLINFFLSALLRDCSLCWDRLEWYI